MDLNLAGKRALVTGSSDGIGLAVAKGLAAEGVEVLINGRHASKVEAACDVDRRSGAPRSRRCGKDRGHQLQFWKLCDRFTGGVDILINNAGTGSNETIMEAPDQKWQDYWDLHVMAAIRLARGVVPAMEEERGRVSSFTMRPSAPFSPSGTSRSTTSPRPL